MMYMQALAFPALFCGSLLIPQAPTLPLPREAAPIVVKAQQEPSTQQATDPELVGAATSDYLAEFKVKNAPAGTALIWDVYPDDKFTAVRVIKSEKGCVVAGAPRDYKIRVRLVKGEDVSQLEKTFTLTGGQPIPNPPTPPKPPTPPTPPNPPTPPTPNPAPIPVAGFRVMIVYQDKDKTKLSASQRAVLNGADVRDYLQAKCAVGDDGRTKEYRIWDVDIKGVENESQLWQKAWARQHPTVALIPDPVNPAAKREVPTLWLLVSNGKDGYEGPILPTTQLSEVMGILKKYGE